jgi:murein L,D-transpeptidase YcbB/YkuD
LAFVAFVAVAAGFAMPPSARLVGASSAAVAMNPSPTARALRGALADRPDGDIAKFYAARGFAPIWVRGDDLSPEARRLLRSATTAEEHGLDPPARELRDAEAAVRELSRGNAARVRADLALTQLLTVWISDLHRPPPEARMQFADPAVDGPPETAAEVLRRFGTATSADAGLSALETMNPIYEELRSAWRVAISRGDAALARTLRANMERARGLPATFGESYILVDVAAQELELWDEGRAAETMPVVVGKPSEPTPMLAGVIRFLVLNPYWHMPPDLAAERVAPLAARQGGRAALARQGLQLVSDFSPRAVSLDPDAVDWDAVAAGRQRVHLRQAPGPGNMMGRVKFIFPNRLGVYLHDTPYRSAFSASRRTESAGCVRVSDAPGLARRLTRGDVQLAGSGRPEERVELSRPTPVYLVYFTLRARDGVIERRLDIYGRDLAPSGSPRAR